MAWYSRLTFSDTLSGMDWTGVAPANGGAVEDAVRGRECDCRGVAAPDELGALGADMFGRLGESLETALTGIRGDGCACDCREDACS